mgnify:CR=1 FL=1
MKQTRGPPKSLKPVSRGSLDDPLLVWYNVTRINCKMTIKVAVLKSGEDVIADIQEMVIKDSEGVEKTVGYFFKQPCIAQLFGQEPKDEKIGEMPFRIRLTHWMPLAKDEKIPVVIDWVISIVDPIDELMEMYQRGLKNYEDRKSQAAGSDERAEDSESGGGSSVGVG